MTNPYFLLMLKQWDLEKAIESGFSPGSNAQKNSVKNWKGGASFVGRFVTRNVWCLCHELFFVTVCHRIQQNLSQVFWTEANILVT